MPYFPDHRSFSAIICSTVFREIFPSIGPKAAAFSAPAAAPIAVINNGMNLMHINSYWQKVVIGAIILFAVILDMAQKKKKV